MSHYSDSRGKRKAPLSDDNLLEKKSKKRQRKNAEIPEKRLARYKSSCPQNIRDRMERVMTQRFFLVERERDEVELREEFKVLGSTGNVYTVIVDKLPSCDCPDACKGNHCKHILFVFLKVLNVSLISPYWYQKALLTDELSSIFANAPTNPTVLANSRVREAFSKADGKSCEAQVDQKERRVPSQEDDCPICYETMGSVDWEKKLTFCDQCGNALHKECFNQWARTKNPLTCVWCRAEWATGPSGGSGGSHNEEGYVNLGSVAGLSPERDTSTCRDYEGYGGRYGGRSRGYRSYGCRHECY